MKARQSSLYLVEVFKDYLVYADSCLDKFPETERFGLYRVIRNMNYDLIGEAVMMNSFSQPEKELALKALKRRLQALKFFLRYCYDYRHSLTVHSYGILFRKLGEVENVLGYVL